MSTERLEWQPELRPELKVIYKGLEVVVNNTRMTEAQLIRLLEEGENPASPGA